MHADYIFTSKVHLPFMHQKRVSSSRQVDLLSPKKSAVHATSFSVNDSDVGVCVAVAPKWRVQTNFYKRIYNKIID